MVGNLRATANSVTKAINANTPAFLYSSTGYAILNHVQVPSYVSAPLLAQVQPVSSGDLRQLDALNIQGAQKSIYLNGAALGVIRVKRLGGDLIVFPAGTLPEGDVWLVLASLEQWSGRLWGKVAVKLQDDMQGPSTSSLSTDLTDPNNIVVVPAVLTGV